MAEQEIRRVIDGLARHNISVREFADRTDNGETWWLFNIRGSDTAAVNSVQSALGGMPNVVILQGWHTTSPGKSSIDVHTLRVPADSLTAVADRLEKAVVVGAK